MARPRIIAIAAAFAASLAWAPAGSAQEKKDDPIDRILEKLEGSKPAPPNEPAPKTADDKDKAKEKDKDKDAKPADAKKSADKPKAKPVEVQDKGLDSILEKLGETKEEPTTEGKPQPGPADSEPKPGAKPDDVADSKLDEKQKALDEHIEELTGVKKKKKGQDQKQGQSDENSPLGQVVKKMREVEQKLGDSDTGKDTQKKGAEIVKDFDNLIAQAKKQGQGQGKPGRKTKQAGNQKGQQPQQDQPGATGDPKDGVGASKPKNPENVAALVGDKNTWGNLPPQLRDEMDNVFAERSLEKRADLIKRYYEAFAKKSGTPRGE